MLKSSNRVRVLHLITELVLGGAQDNTLLTVEGLPRDRFEVHLAGAPGGEWEERSRLLADRTYSISSMRRGIHAFENGRALFEIISLLKQQKYDILHTHSTNAGILGRIAGKIAGVPVILHTVHGFGFEDYTFSPAARRVLLWLERICAHLCDRMVMVAELNKTQALNLGLAPENKMITIHSGIDLRLFDTKVNGNYIRRYLGLSRDWPMIGWVGRLSEQNAPEVMISAARCILEEHPQAFIIIVGDGPLHAQIEAMCRPCPQIRMLGFRDDVPQLLPAFDVFVSTVRWAGLGRAVTEAMIAGRPVVATAVNGVPEIVHHGETGLLVPPDAPQAIAKEVIYLLNNPAFAQKLGANAHAEVVPEFSAQRMVTRIADLYEHLLVEKGVGKAAR